MKTRIWALLIGLVVVVGVVTAFATGDADEAADGTADNVFLGELDLAERMEIWRNQFRRMTPGDAPLVQDVGTWPAAWEEFGSAWDAAPATRDLATWLVPVTAERSGVLTVLRDANGNTLWSGATDFAKEKSANVTLTGALVDEEDWDAWRRARNEICRRLGALHAPDVPLRGYSKGPCTTGLHFVSASADFTNAPPSFMVGLTWTNIGTVDMFAYGPLHVAETNEVTYTNDENVVVTVTNVTWHSIEPSLTGRYDNLWEHVGTMTVSNTGTNVFVDTNFPPERAKVRYYAAFETGDADNDGLNDAFETRILCTSTNSTDSDNDGLSDGDEYFIHRTNPNAVDSDHDGIDDPNEIQDQTNPNNWDTDEDLGGDAVDPSPSFSNSWWVVSKTTNEWIGYGHVVVGNEPSWPTSPVWTNQLIVQGVRPYTNAIPGRVTLWGLVDDAIMVDSNKVAWTKGAKVLSNLDVTASITNLASDSFRIDLFDWPDLPNGGPNEVLLGREDHPFRVVWEWCMPFNIQLEPVFTSSTFPLDNPSGIIQGSNAWFHVNVFPSNLVPETNILWAVQNGNIELAPSNRGARVSVSATTVGDDEIRATVDGALGDPGFPPFHVKVKPLNVVTAQVGVLEDEDENWVVGSDHVWDVIHEANGILAQTGIQLEVLPPYRGIPDSDDYWDLCLASNQTVTSLMSELPNAGGVEIYFVHTIRRQNGGYDSGVNSPLGIALSATASGRSLAHEIGHACGMPDIYVVNTNEDLMVSGFVREAWMPRDWGNYLTNTVGLLEMSNAVKRLMMYGVGGATTIKGDVPSGTMHGIGFERTWENGNEQRTWTIDDWEVGLPGMIMHPHHQ